MGGNRSAFLASGWGGGVGWIRNLWQSDKFRSAKAASWFHTVSTDPDSFAPECSRRDYFDLNSFCVCFYNLLMRTKSLPEVKS